MRLNCFLLLLVMGIGCEIEEESRYPPGVEEVDLNSVNDCSLSACSLNRVIRLKANNVQGIIRESTDGDFVLSYPFTFDSHISFHICELPVEFQRDNLEVSYDGLLRDACGIHSPSGPAEATYILRLTRIEEI